MFVLPIMFAKLRHCWKYSPLHDVWFINFPCRFYTRWLSRISAARAARTTVVAATFVYLHLEVVINAIAPPISDWLPTRSNVFPTAVGESSSATTRAVFREFGDATMRTIAATIVTRVWIARTENAHLVRRNDLIPFLLKSSQEKIWIGGIWL